MPQRCANTAPQHTLAPSDHPDLHLVIYTPVLTTDTPARLHQLLGRQTRVVVPEDLLDGGFRSRLWGASGRGR
jgi:hypothetical protein